MHEFLLAATIFGASATALPQAENAIPPPQRIDDMAISDWLRAYIDMEGWVVIAADHVAVALGSPTGVVVRADGYLQADIRHEYYEPTTIGSYRTSSNLQTRVIDCGERRQRVIAMTLFERNNLRAELASQSNDSAPWTTPSKDSVGYRVMDRVCRAPAEGEPMPPSA